jgi:flagellar export protein FliJ
MAELDPLIRYRKHRLDEKQRRLADLYAQAEAIEQQKAQLFETMNAEADAAEASGDVYMVQDFLRFSANVREKIEELDNQREKLEVRIDAARRDIQEAFGELKKIEITQERRQAEREELDKREEDKELDDIGLENYRRGDNETS